MELSDVLIQTSGALFFCASADEDEDGYTLPAEKTVLILQQQTQGGIAFNMVKAVNMIGKPTEIRVSKYGAVVQDVTDNDFLSKAYEALTGVIRATTGQAKKVIAEFRR
jgi:hypothetical protein